MKPLFLNQFHGDSESEVLAHLITAYEAPSDTFQRFEPLVAFEDAGCWEGTSFFLLRERATGALFENHASHCSCYGFEGQWRPEPTTVEYLKSDKFWFSSGGCNGTVESVKQFIAENFK